MESPNKSPYKHVAYKKYEENENEVAFNTRESRGVAEAIIHYMSVHGAKHPDNLPAFPAAGFHEPELESILSVGSKWRSARHDPLGLPGKPSKNWVIEACSPTYAKMAMGTGMHHATALPCEISVQIVDRDGNGSTESLVISYLDPNFMLGALFADMSDDEKEALGDIPGIILNDLENIVKYALDKSGINSANGEQFYYTMY